MPKNRELKNRKTGNRNGQRNLKIEVFQYKNRKIELKKPKIPTSPSSSNMKRIIPDNRHHSSFERDRKKAKADALAYGVKVAVKKRNATGHR